MNNKYYNADDIGLYTDGPDDKYPKNEQELKKIYDIFGIKNLPRDDNGRLLNPTHILYEEIFDEKLDLDQLCLSDM